MLDCVVMKNWLPFVLGPQFAMDTLPGAECLRGKRRGAGVCAEGGGGTCAQASKQAHRQQTLATAGITIGRQAPSAGRHHLWSAARYFCDQRDRLSSKFSSSKRGP